MKCEICGAVVAVCALCSIENARHMIEGPAGAIILGDRCAFALFPDGVETTKEMHDYELEFGMYEACEHTSEW